MFHKKREAQHPAAARRGAAPQGPATDLIHLVNNSGDMHRPVGEFIPVRGIAIELARRKVSRVRSLRLEKELRHTFRDGRVRIALPLLKEYDVVVIE